MVVGGQRVWIFTVQRRKAGELVRQHLENQARIQLRIVDMPRLQPPVMVVLHEVMVGVAREGKRIEPERVDRGRSQLGQSWPVGKQMRQVVAQDVVADDVIGAGAETSRRSRACSNPPERKTSGGVSPGPTAANAKVRAAFGSTSRSIEMQRDRNASRELEADGSLSMANVN